MQLGIYKHHKGHLAEVIGVATHTETEEELVVYKHNGKMWVRPLAMFQEYVVVDGVEVPRFTFVSI